MPQRPSPRGTITAKTTDYQVLITDNGTLFTNRGAAGTVIFTLPTIATLPSGWTCDFYQVADFTMTVAAAAGKLVVFNDAAANSITFSTASELIGNSITVISDGTSFLVIPHIAAEGVTITIAT